MARPSALTERGWTAVARWDWRLGEGGDPWAQLQAWVAAQGFPVVDMSSGQDVDTGFHREARRVLLLGAAAAARAVGAPVGAPSPLPGVPDVVAVVQERGGPRGDRAVRAVRALRGHVDAWTEQWDRDRHLAAVEEVRRRIAAGEVYQVNVVGCWTGVVHGDPFGTARRVLALPGATWRGSVCGDDWVVACASPENVLVVRAGEVSSRPVKGTLPVGVDRGASRGLLRASAKDRAEHVMIVDLVRNDLGRICRAGSVQVSELFATQEWSGLWHAHSTVRGRLADRVDLAGILRAVLPGGSVTGAPKLAALDVIDALEPVGRGPSMGALGWLGEDGHLELGLTIRTVAVDASRSGAPIAALWAGGGITWGSDPAGERAEALAKAQPLLSLLASATR